MPFDDFWYDDFDGDGKIGWSDKFFSDWMYDDLAHSWRKEVEDGSEYGLDPDDFESQESYEKALDEAKHEWRATAAFSFDLDPEDYETEEEYNAALEGVRKGRPANRYERLPYETIASPGVSRDAAGPTEEDNTSAVINPEVKQEIPVPSRKKNISSGATVCIVVAMLVMLAFAIWIGFSSKPERAARQDYIDRVKELCASYGVDNTTVDLTKGDYAYNATVIANKISDLDYQDQYELVKAIEGMEVEGEGVYAYTRTRILCNFKEYEIKGNDEYTLQIDYKDVYVDEREAERRFREAVKRKSVYVGLPEKYIKITASGPYDEVEYCEGFDDLPAKDRTVTYKWYFDDGEQRLDAVVGYWDKETQTETEGTVIRVNDFFLDHYRASHSASSVTTPSQKTTTKTKTTTTGSDPYDVDDYSDPDEFYYYHYDDFYDYEDAEDYFYDHDD